jgi:hypothetical protein
MATTVTQGNRLYGTDTNIQIVPIQDRIPLLSPATNPITAAVMYGNQIFQTSKRTKKLKVRKEKLVTELASWRTGNLVPKTATVASGIAADATSVTLGSGEANYYLVDDILQNARTREQVIVTAVDTSTNTLTIKRAPENAECLDGQTAQAAMVSGDTMARVSNAVSENGTINHKRSVNVSQFTNYAQYFRAMWGASERVTTSEFHGGDPKLRDEKGALYDLASDLEQALVMGEPDNRNDSSGNPKQMMRGLYSFLNEYGDVRGLGSAALGRSQWDEWLRDLEKIDLSKRIIFCNATVLAYIDTWADAKVTIDLKSEISAFGVNVISYVCTLGTYTLIHHPLLDEAYAPCDAIALNPDYLTILEKMPFEIRRDVQDKKQTSEEDMCVGIYSMKLEFPNTMGALTNCG